MRVAQGTYVYAGVAGRRGPRLTRVPAGLPGTGKVRLLDAVPDLFVVVADAPLDRYGEAAINRGLADLDWVSRAAVAHEAVVEAFIGEMAVLPMKLFTIFMNDERVLAHVRADRQRIAALIARVADHQEWGIRVVLDRTRAAGAQRPNAEPGSPAAAAGSADRVLEAPDSTLLDVLDHLLNKGVMLNGDVTLGVAGIDLIYLRLSSILCAADRVLPSAAPPPVRRPQRRRRPAMLKRRA